MLPVSNYSYPDEYAAIPKRDIINTVMQAKHESTYKGKPKPMHCYMA